jgi:hypothetical protein
LSKAPTLAKPVFSTVGSCRLFNRTASANTGRFVPTHAIGLKTCKISHFFRKTVTKSTPQRPNWGARKLRKADKKPQPPRGAAALSFCRHRLKKDAWRLDHLKCQHGRLRSAPAGSLDRNRVGPGGSVVRDLQREVRRAGPGNRSWAKGSGNA